jgi:hypothetical protein
MTHVKEDILMDMNIQNADDRMRYQMAAGLNAKLTRDGNAWCWLIGDNLQDGVAGFGASPRGALDDLWTNFHKGETS